jgi:hypothetical protein
MKNLSSNQIFLLNRAGRDEKYLAHSLVTYMQSKGLGWADLADELNCNEESLLKLALCRSIDTQSSNFSELLQNIATYAGIDAFTLANVLKKAAFSAAFPAEKDAYILSINHTYLAAAREKNAISSEDQT